MTATATSPHSRSYPFSLEAWVDQLMDAFPWFDDCDIAETIAGKTNIPVTQRDFAAITACCIRTKLRAWSAP
jgi:hypothetical protein